MNATEKPISRASRRSTWVRAAVVATTLLTSTFLTGCKLQIHHGLSSSSTCADYVKASAQDEAAFVEDLYHRAHPNEPQAGPAAVNAVFNVSYECQQSPHIKIGDLSDFHN